MAGDWVRARSHRIVGQSGWPGSRKVSEASKPREQVGPMPHPAFRIVGAPYRIVGFVIAHLRIDSWHPRMETRSPFPSRLNRQQK
jgi:hypothetical protein